MNRAADWLQSNLDAGHAIRQSKRARIVLSDFQRRAVDLLSRALKTGIYNVSTNWEKADFTHPRSLRLNLYAGGGLATFDFNHLTRFVILAHDECVRVSIEPSGRGLLKIVLSERQREGDWSTMHPTLEQAIREVRGT